MRRLIIGIALAALALGSFEVLAQQPPPQPELGLNSRGRPRVSPRRTAEFVVDAVQVKLEWGSPYKRGRVIWGTLVPWGRWWMPGADETTTITTSGDLLVGDLHVPAGVHSIYTLPGDETFMLVLNKGTNLFHTEYPQRLDLGRVPMTRVTVTDFVEQLTFGVEAKAEGGGRLTMAWDDREYSVPLAAARP
jgi:hypothetical protein